MFMLNESSENEEKIERVNKKCFKGTSERCGALFHEVWL